MSLHQICIMRVHTLSIPTRAVHAHGSGDIAAINTVLLELKTESGLTGWGEASPWPVFAGTVESAVAALHIYLRPYVIGADPLQMEPLLHRADRIIVDCAAARAALETALLDLAGQISNLSLTELLGGRQRDAIELSFSVANPDFDADIEDIEALYAEGVRIFKIKTGFAAHEFDLMRLERLQTRFGDSIRLRADYNQGAPPHDALRRLRDLERFDLDFIEQPVRGHQYEIMAALNRELNTPIMADESVFDLNDARRAIEMGIAGVFSLKIMKSGGIRNALHIAALARSAGIAVYAGCMFETAIAHTAGAHLAAALPDLTLGCEFYMARYYAEQDIAADPLRIEEGWVHPPHKPGLGIVPDPDKLSRYQTGCFG